MTILNPVWNGSIWGDYYINMLDSNTLNNGGNYWPDILSGDAGVYNKPKPMKGRKHLAFGFNGSKTIQ